MQNYLFYIYNFGVVLLLSLYATCVTPFSFSRKDPDILMKPFFVLFTPVLVIFSRQKHDCCVGTAQAK